MIIKLKNKHNDIHYFSMTEENLYIHTAKYTEHDNSYFYYFKLEQLWFSYDILGEEGKFDTREEVEELAKIIVDSILNNLSLLDLNETIKKVKKQ